jgi:hypothetical protein
VIERWRERLRAAPAADAAALAALGAVALGVAVVADRLVAAAQATPQAAALDWPQRLALGLWTFRVEHALWLTVGGALLLGALIAGARLGGWRAQAARLTGGLLVGMAIVAAAVVLGSTYVAIAGGVGEGFGEVSFTDRERLFTWLRQAVTAAGGAIAWALLAARLSAVAEAPVPADADEEPDEAARPAPAARQGRPAVPTPAAAPAVRAAAPAAPAPEPPAPAPQPPASSPRAAPPAADDRWAPRPPPTEPVPAVAPAPSVGDPAPAANGALSTEMERLYRERLAFSPSREAAREMVERVRALERDGQGDEARALAERLRALAGR